MKTNLERQKERLRRKWQAVVEANGTKKTQLLADYHKEAESYQNLKSNYSSIK